MEPAQSDAASARANSKSPEPLPDKQLDQSIKALDTEQALDTEEVSTYAATCSPAWPPRDPQP